MELWHSRVARVVYSNSGFSFPFQTYFFSQIFCTFNSTLRTDATTTDFTRSWPLTVFKHICLPPVLWRCWLGGRKGVRLLKNWVMWCRHDYLSGARHMAQLTPLPLTVSCFSKIQIVFTFLVPAHPGSPRQISVKWGGVCASILVSVLCLCTHLHIYTTCHNITDITGRQCPMRWPRACSGA